MTSLRINGQEHDLDVPDDMPLLWVLRDVLGLTGTKFGCGVALCGACTVHVDGRPIRSCITPAASIADKAITTIEAIGETPSGKRIQQAWLSLEVVNAVTASPARSCLPQHSLSTIRTQAMPRSMRLCPATSAVAAPIRAFAPR
jgi:aerobic-type carbon monoxide dehydrogenase small subunit (CoxS/CutS family)